MVNGPSGVFQELPRFNFVEELEQDGPEEHLVGALIALVDNVPNQELTDPIRCTIGISEFEVR